MFSRIRNHEKLVENGENPFLVAKKIKEGSHERDSDPHRVVGKMGGGSGSQGVGVTGRKNEQKNIVQNINKNGGDDKTEIVEEEEEEGEEEGDNDGNEVALEGEVEGEGEEGVKVRRPKNRSTDIQYELSSVIELHSYVDPKKNKNGKENGKGKGKGKGASFLGKKNIFNNFIHFSLLYFILFIYSFICFTFVHFMLFISFQSILLQSFYFIHLILFTVFYIIFFHFIFFISFFSFNFFSISEETESKVEVYEGEIERKIKVDRDSVYKLFFCLIYYVYYQLYIFHYFIALFIFSHVIFSYFTHLLILFNIVLF